MQVASSLPPQASSLKSRAFVTSGQAARHCGCSINTVKALLASGELEGYTTAGGHSRISTSSLLTYLYGEQDSASEAMTANKGVVCYCRTSSYGQKASLERQVERMLTEVSEKEGIDREDLPVFQDLCSAFANRDSLNRLVDAMLNGEVKRIYCEFYDRLSRVPCLSALIEHIARRCGVEIIALDVEEQDLTAQEEFVKELIAYITVAANRVSAQKSAKVTTKHIAPDVLSRLFALRNQGYSLTQVTAIAKKEGLKCEDSSPLSYFKVRSTIYNGNGKANAAVLGLENVYDPHAELRSWVQDHLQDAPDGERVRAADVTAAYRSHCKAKGYRALNPGQLGGAVKEVWGDRKQKSHGVVYYKFLALN